MQRQSLLTFSRQNMFQLNLQNFIFLNFTIVIVIFGFLVNAVEPYLPTLIKQSYRYGKISYKGEQCRLASMLEIPKSYFRHFYVFAVIWSSGLTYFAVQTLLLKLQPAPNWILRFLDLVTGSKERPVEVDSSVCLVAMVLISLQCWRRWYETHFVQVFSSKSKINLSHYLVGYLHYFATITGILANAEGFVEGSKPNPFRLSDLNALQIFAIGLFLYSWLQQYRSNMILVDLRKDVGGKVVTEKHLMPQGGWFDEVSSPHMLFEILMYFALFLLMPNCITMRYAAVWVMSNQMETAWLTHKWYKETFRLKYPKERKAILPWLL